MRSFLFFSLGLVFVVPLTVSAAELTINAPTNVISVEDEFEFSVVLSSVGTSINALEGTVVFPNDLLAVKSVQDSNGVVTLWIKRPSETSHGSITFSGIIPGGFSGSAGPLFTVVFEAKKKGNGTLRFHSLQALVNDGSGTEEGISTHPWSFKITPQPGTSTVLVHGDTTPPEPFGITLATSTDLFNEQPFIVFLAADKGSGILRYEVCEGWLGSCVEATSPHVLAQGGESIVRVKAVDHAGNVRTATLYTSMAILNTTLHLFAVILVLGTCAILFRRLRRR